MKQAIMIGAGNIGRGFIGALLEKSGYHVVFADVAEQLISAINERKQYTIHIQDNKCEEWTVSGISGIVASDQRLAEAVAGPCELITTAVGLWNLPAAARPIAAGIRMRKAAGCTRPLNIVACENALRATSQLRDAVLTHLSRDEAAYLEEYVGFADCTVDRIVPKASFDNPLDVAVERYTEWGVEKAGWKGELPQIQDCHFLDNLSAYLERKLFTLNSGHAVCAYLGALRGYQTILESISDPVIGDIVYQAMKESGESLIRTFGFDPAAHQSYIDHIFARFQNPYLRDEVRRVAWEPIRKLSPADRLIKPLTAAFGYGLCVDYLMFGAAAALHYSCPEDRQSVELGKRIEAEGVGAALAHYSGLKPEEVLFGRILDMYRALSV